MKKWKAMMALPLALLVSPMTVMAGDTKEVTMAFCAWTGAILQCLLPSRRDILKMRD